MIGSGTAKDLLKTLLYRSGIAPWLGRRLTRDTLTVLMFHRVLPSSDPRCASADRDYTIDLGVFEAFLDFLSQQLCTVSLAAVQAAQAGGPPLPPNAVLVTFDDGWEDTARHAAPALCARGLPSVVFVTSGALTCEHTLWRDVAAILVRAGSLSREESASLERLSPESRGGILNDALHRAGSMVQPLMMRASDLAAVRGQGMAIGAHGASHAPLPQAKAPADELRGGRLVLEAATGDTVDSFAFPYGRYDPATLGEAFATGYRLVFTSDGVLNALKNGRPLSPVLGRINIAQDQLTAADGAFSPVRAAFYLLFRPIAALDRKAGSSAGY